MKGLEIKDLSVQTADGQSIIRHLSLHFDDSQIYALVGHNGCGKTTLVETIMGRPNHIVTGGQILLDGEDIAKLPTEQRAKRGLFLALQQPVEAPGISYSDFIRTALVNLGGQHCDFFTVLSDLQDEAKALGFRHFDYRRDLNVGFSGGEKKKSEIIQLFALRPRFAFLDEPDSGLDKDSVNRLAEQLRQLDFPITLIIISHHDRLLSQLQPSATYNLEKLNAPA